MFKIRDKLAIGKSGGIAMKLLIWALQERKNVELRFLKDGWKVIHEELDCFAAIHAGVADQEEARRRLFELGLLTSHKVRIEFREVCPN